MEKNWLKYFKYSRLKNLIHVLLYTSFYQSSLIITIEKAMPTFQTMENSLKKIKFSWKYLYTCILFIVYQFYRWYQNNICHLKQAKQIFPYWQSSNFTVLKNTNDVLFLKSLKYFSRTEYTIWLSFSFQINTSISRLIIIQMACHISFMILLFLKADLRYNKTYI